jgi:hypothetical protein
VGGVTVPLPDIRLTDLGTGPEGITAAELAERVLAAIKTGAAKAVSGSAGDLGKMATSAVKDAGGTGSNAVQSITKGIGGLFKKDK